MLSDGSVGFSFEKIAESLFFVATDFLGQTLEDNIALAVFVNRNVGAEIRTEEIIEGFIVNFQIGTSESDGGFITRLDLGEQMTNNSWHNTSVLVIQRTSAHCECLSGACLSVTEDCPGITVKSRHNNVLCDIFVDDFLGSVHENFVEFERPVFLLMIHMTLGFILGNVDIDETGFFVDFKVFGGEVSSGTDSNQDFNGSFDHCERTVLFLI